MTKVLSLFSGIGAFERACCRIGLDWELVNYCEIDRVHGISNSQLYKQAGNSIVVNVLSALLSQLFYRDLI